MARIRKVEIKNFRSIKELSWTPTPGINCLIGPGDSGKSTILDAIDFCLGARRTVQFSDADFYKLDEESSIEIRLTIGELDDALRSFDIYGDYLRGYNSEDGNVEDEPERNLETVLTVCLVIDSDLEPKWSLISDKAAAKGLSRNLSWGDRTRLAPTRIGTFTDYNLAWRKGSVLNQLADEKPDASGALAKAARNARAAFGDEAQEQLGETLTIVTQTANELGIPVGETVKAMLDAHSVSFGGGTISLHNEEGVPLRGLGLGSTRLLIAGLQRKAAEQSSMVLVDELEHGLEPHRIIRFIGSLGAKETSPPLQVFATTHSPVALRELSGEQLIVLRSMADKHVALPVSATAPMQGTIRCFPEAFLAHSVIICEGASEVGFIRGIDQYRASLGQNSIYAQGVSLVDSGGGAPDRFFERATPFQNLGYRTSIFRDDDQKPTAATEAAFVENSGSVFTWTNNRALEEALFASLDQPTAEKMLQYAVDIRGIDTINAQIKAASNEQKNLNSVIAELAFGQISNETRAYLGQAAKTGNWFKTVSHMENIGREIIGPNLMNAETSFQQIVGSIFDWAQNADA